MMHHPLQVLLIISLAFPETKFSEKVFELTDELSKQGTLYTYRAGSITKVKTLL